MNEIKNILESNEKIVWQGKINRNVLIFSLIFPLIVVLIISLFFFSQKSVNVDFEGGSSRQFNGQLIGFAIIILGLIFSLIKFFVDFVKEYLITEKRVVIKSGIIGTDFKSIYFDQIKNVMVDVGLIGKIFKVGSIKIDIGKTRTYSTGGTNNQPTRVETKTMYDVLKHIDSPYETFKYVQSSLEGRKESLYSGRADRESNPDKYNN